MGWVMNNVKKNGRKLLIKRKQALRPSPGEGSKRMSWRLKFAYHSVFLKPLLPRKRNFLDKYKSSLSDMGETFK